MIRILWRFSPDMVSLDDLTGEPPPATHRLGFAERYRVSPVFEGNRRQLFEETNALPLALGKDPENDLARYYQIVVEDLDAASPILATLQTERAAGRVVWFDLQSAIGTDLPSPSLTQGSVIPCQPSASGPTPAYDGCQLYLGPPALNSQGPSGVNARFAWGLKGGRGEQVSMVDIDDGGNLSHEDLLGQISAIGNISPNSHGTAVLGILRAMAQNPPMGVIGIAHRAKVSVAQFSPQPNLKPSPEDVIKEASKKLHPGDVLLLELQATRTGLQPTAGNKPRLPLEAWPQGRTAIARVPTGVYVIEVAANGGFTLSPQAHDVPSSGSAIMVGAGNLVTGKALSFSNRGPRVDLQGWGHEIVTTGANDGIINSDLQARSKSSRCYTKSFGGTSGAAAIVAGCVAVISSIVKAHGLPTLSPAEMKILLQCTGTFQDRAANGEIGPLPDLKAAVESLEERFKQEDPKFLGFKQTRRR